MNAPFKFEALRSPVEWTGRYNRIPGKEPVFKARVNGTAFAYWSPWQSGEILTSDFVECPGLREMVKAINRAKEAYAGQPGGGFQINEFGQVLCPVVGSSKRYWVGTVTGVPSFRDPRSPGSTFDLALPPSTEVGTPWARPYIGMKFNLDGSGSIYFKEDEEDVSRKLRLSRSYPELVRLLRQVRDHGQTIRFIVNLHGIVVTKREPDWEPVYVGQVDLNRWFQKES